MSFQLDDREFMQAFSSLMARWDKNSRVGIRRYADAAADAMRRHIHSVSGDLAGAVKVDDHLNENPPWLEVGAFETGPDPHGLYTEFGTVKESPRPFARPALLEAERNFTVDE